MRTPGRHTLADLWRDLLDERPQRAGVGRPDEEERAEPEVECEVRKHLRPVLGRTDDGLVRVAGGRGRRRREGTGHVADAAELSPSPPRPAPRPADDGPPPRGGPPGPGAHHPGAPPPPPT